MKSLKLVLVMSFVILAFTNESCEGQKKESKVDSQIAAKTEQAMQEANRQVGMPAIHRFTEKKLMKMIYELRDSEKLICHAYLVNEMNGKVGQYLGKCLGYGLPYSTQFSNPEKFGYVDGGQYGARNPYTMPQPEPNGLFMPEGLSATWLLLLDDKGKPHPVYLEPAIIVSPIKLHK